MTLSFFRVSHSVILDIDDSILLRVSHSVILDIDDSILLPCQSFGHTRYR